MNVTFDKGSKQFVWNAIRPLIKDRTCPFCRVKITAKNFAGAAPIDDELRAFDGNIVCLLEFANQFEPEEEG